MGKSDSTDLLKFLAPFADETRENALWLREFAWDLYPDCNELIYDNYNAVAFGWSLTDKLGDTFCSVAVGRGSENVHFGFYWGSKIADPQQLLLGNGNQYRYILVRDVADFPKVYITQLLMEAYAYSLGKLKVKGTAPKGASITKSISDAKRKPGKVLSEKKTNAKS